MTHLKPGEVAKPFIDLVVIKGSDFDLADETFYTPMRPLKSSNNLYFSDGPA